MEKSFHGEPKWMRGFMEKRLHGELKNNEKSPPSDLRNAFMFNCESSFNKCVFCAMRGLLQ